MKNLKNLILAGMIGLGSFVISRNVKGQSYTEKEGDKAYVSLEKGMEISVCEDFALQYLDSSAHILNGKYTKKEVIQKMNLSLYYLEKSEIALNLFIKKSREYSLYENDSLNFTMGIETKLDTNEVKKILPYIKELQEIEAIMLKDDNKINELSLELLNEKYSGLYELVGNYLKED